MFNFIRGFRFEVLLLLAFTVIFCFSLWLLRFAFTGSLTYVFLNWNLFLAILPCYFSSYIVTHRETINRYTFFLLALTWLLFFPNSPYILTDLFHLHERGGMPKWFDLIMILSYAWAGLLFGFISIFQMESILLTKMRPNAAKMIIIALLFASGFGVYLGRYLRWNSWDAVSNPIALTADIGDRFVHPFSHGRTWGVTLLMGTLLTFIYFSVQILKKGIKKS